MTGETTDRKRKACAEDGHAGRDVPGAGQLDVAAALARIREEFVAAVLADYTPWACEGVVTVTVDALAWATEHRPGWLEAAP